MIRDEYGEVDEYEDQRHRSGDVEPFVSYKRTPLRIFPVLDADGFDSEGFAWGAR